MFLLHSLAEVSYHNSFHLEHNFLFGENNSSSPEDPLLQSNPQASEDNTDAMLKIDASKSKKVENRKANSQPETGSEGPEVSNNDAGLLHKKNRFFRVSRPVSFYPPKPKKGCGVARSKLERELEKNSLLPRSFAYMVLQEKSAIYRVEFSTAEANIQPLYVYPRKELFVEPRDKATQLKSEEFMREDYDKNSSRLCMLKKSYEISENVTKKSRSTSPARKSLRVYKDELSSERPSSVSRAERVRTDGIIYVEFNGYMLKIRCDMLQTSKLRQPASKEIKEIIENLNMETTDQRKNKAEVVTRCGNDLLRVTFSMVDINVERAYLKEDVGLQTESENVYLRDRNLITGKTNFISVPESTYNYEDPMKQIHYIHLSFQGTDAIPLWKYNLMQERIAIARGSEELKRDHENAYKRTQGSKLIFEAFDALATVKMGQLCSEVAKGLLNYENSMANLHARRLGGNSLYSRRDEEPVLEESSQVNIVTTSNNFML